MYIFFVQKYIDIFAGTIGFWLFGYAISANTDAPVLGEEQDYIFWFFRVSHGNNNKGLKMELTYYCSSLLLLTLPPSWEGHWWVMESNSELQPYSSTPL